MAALVYPVVTQSLTPIERDYLDGYGLIDIVQVWFAAVALSALVVVAYRRRGSSGTFSGVVAGQRALSRRSNGTGASPQVRESPHPVMRCD